MAPPSGGARCPHCGTNLAGTREHRCTAVLVADPAHTHAFGADGSDCACGVTLDAALEAARTAALAPDRPRASTACTTCWSPITEAERKAGGLCTACLRDAATRTPRTTLVVNLDAPELDLRAGGVCRRCAVPFESTLALDAHIVAAHDGVSDAVVGLEATDETAILESIRLCGQAVEHSPDLRVAVAAAHQLAAHAERLAALRAEAVHA